MSASFIFTAIGFSELTESSFLIIAPNPANGKFRLLTDHSADAEIKIYNGTGQVVYQSKKVNSEIDLSKHSKGLYSIVVNISNKSYNKKMVIQ